MNRTTALITLAVFVGGCATTTYTNPAKGNDPQAMKSALETCEKASQVACSPPGDGYRLCLEGKVKTCMEGAGWNEK
jgi:hypothetical protein